MPHSSTATRPSGAAALAVARMLIASYFIAHASGLVVDPDATAFVSMVLPETEAARATAALVWLTGFAVFVGRYVRPASLILAVHTVWTSLVSHGGLSAAPVDIDALWTDLAMVGALAIVALTAPREPKHRARRALGRGLPRRVTPGTPVKPRLRVAPIAAPAETEDRETIILFGKERLRRSA